MADVFPVNTRFADGGDPAPVLVLPREVDEISEIISEIEPEPSGMPILIKNYLRLVSEQIRSGSGGRRATDPNVDRMRIINEEIDRISHTATRYLKERRDCIIVSSVSCIYGIG